MRLIVWILGGYQNNPSIYFAVSKKPKAQGISVGEDCYPKALEEVLSEGDCLEL